MGGANSPLISGTSRNNVQELKQKMYEQKNLDYGFRTRIKSDVRVPMNDDTIS